jgi:hypothetical protein
MNAQELLQALKLTLGSTNEEIRMAETALEKVIISPTVLTTNRPEQ